MAYLRGLWTFVLCHFAFSAASGSKLNYNLPTHIIPEHYELTLYPELRNTFSFEGSLSVKLNIIEKSNNITLHSKDLNIEDYSIILINNQHILKPKEVKYENQTDFLILIFDKEIIGSYNLELAYTGKLSDDEYGFFKEDYTNEQNETIWLAATKFHPIGARRAFPCLDDPKYRATFKVTVIHAKQYKALSNMPVENIEEKEDVIVVTFKTTPRISTYGVAVVVSDLYQVSNEENNFSIWTRKKYTSQARLALALAEKSFKVFQDYIGVLYPVNKLDLVALPGYGVEQKSTLGLGLFGEKNVLSEPSIQYGSCDIITMYVHQWFDNLVGPWSWKSLWVNNGFSNFFQMYLINKVVPSWESFQLLFISDAIHSYGLILDSNDYLSIALNSDIENPKQIRSLSPLEHNKGGAVIRMMQHFLSEDIFKQALRDFFVKYSDKPASTDELFDSFQQTAATHKLVLGSDVRNIMNTWTNQKGYPIINVIRNYETGTATLSQKRFVTVVDKTENCTNKWWVPINYATQGNSDFSNTGIQELMEPNNNLTVNGPFNPDQWLILNKQVTGFYRVNYDTKNWLMIADYLDSDDHENIPILNRIQLVDDVLACVMNGHLHESILMEMTVQLSREEKYLVWRRAFSFFWYLRSKLVDTPYEERLRKYLLSRMVHMVTPELFENTNDLDQAFEDSREHIIKWSCVLGHKMCIRAAKKSLKAWLATTPGSSESLGIATSILCQAMRNANFRTWSLALARYTYTESFDEREKILHAISCSSDKYIMDYFINNSARNDTPSWPISIEMAIMMIARNSRVGVPVILDFLMNTWPTLPESERDSIHNFLPLPLGYISNYFRSKEDLLKLVNWSEKYDTSRHASSVSIKKIEDKLYKFNWFKTQEGMKYLDAFFKGHGPRK